MTALRSPWRAALSNVPGVTSRPPRPVLRQATIRLVLATACSPRAWSPPGNLEDLVGAYGWLHTPLMLKLPVPAPLRSDAELSGGPGFWSKALRALGLRREYMHHPIQPDRARVPTETASQVGSVASAHLSAKVPPWSGKAEEGTVLTVHLFGQMRVVLDDVLVDNWSSGPGRRVFKYLLSHRDPLATQEMLMDVFWPGSTPEAARNNLRVAVHR